MIILLFLIKISKLINKTQPRVFSESYAEFIYRGGRFRNEFRHAENNAKNVR